MTKFVVAYIVVLFSFSQVYPFEILGLDVMKSLVPVSTILMVAFSQHKTFNKNLIALFPFVVFSGLSILWSFDSGRSLSYFLNLLILFLFALFLTSSKYKSKIFEIIVRLSWLSPLLIFASIFYDNTAINTFEFAKRMTFDTIGVNAVAISLAINLLLQTKSLAITRFSLKTFRFIMIMITAFLILRTGTRSVIYGLLLVLSVPWIMKRPFTSILLGIIVFLYFNDQTSNIQINQRVFDFDFGENERWFLWKQALLWYYDHPFGSGFGMEEVAFIGLEIAEAHNQFLTTLVESNVIGLLLLTFSMVYLLVNACRKYKTTLLSTQVIVFLLLQMLKGTFLDTRLFWFPIIILTLSLVEDEQNFDSRQIPRK